MPVDASVLTRRIPRVHDGGTHGATLVLKQMYRLEGRFFSRLLYMAQPGGKVSQARGPQSDPPPPPGEQATNVFDRAGGGASPPAPFQDYSMIPRSVELRAGGR